VAELSPKDAEVIEAVLRMHPSVTSDDERIYFLTTTPMDKWRAAGDWTALPGGFHERIADLEYRPATGAYLRDSSVFDRQTDNPAWMQWITIKRWISEHEVEVENGVWCCPLGGGASTSVFEKRDGNWELKSLGKSWVS
jgi:hypothetical protein